MHIALKYKSLSQKNMVWPKSTLKIKTENGKGTLTERLENITEMASVNNPLSDISEITCQPAGSKSVCIFNKPGDCLSTVSANVFTEPQIW